MHALASHACQHIPEIFENFQPLQPLQAIRQVSEKNSFSSNICCSSCFLPHCWLLEALDNVSTLTSVRISVGLSKEIYTHGLKMGTKAAGFGGEDGERESNDNRERRDYDPVGRKRHDA